MNGLGCAHFKSKEFELAVWWFAKGAEAGLPTAMHNFGTLLDAGEGVASPDCQAAAGWYRLAADAGVGKAAQKPCAMYTLGRGRAWQIMHRSLTCIDSLGYLPASF